MTSGDIGQLITNVQLFDRKVQAKIGMVAEYRATQAEAWMKMNAPWTDRTGAARSGLRAVAVNNAGTSIIIKLFYSVHYGIWLELKNSGRYAVLVPALRVQGQALMASLNGLFSRLGGGGAL